MISDLGQKWLIYYSQWSPKWVGLSLVIDLLMGISSLTAPFILFYFSRKRPDIKVHWVLKLFSVSLFVFGLAEISNVFLMWYNEPVFYQLVKVTSVILALATTISFWPAVPKAVDLPSQEMLNEAIDCLKKENQERQRIEDDLRTLHVELEKRVDERTAELEAINSALCREINQRKRAQRELSDRESQLKVITDAIPASVAYIDQDLMIQFSNETFDRWWGLNKKDVLGRPLIDVIGDVVFYQLRDKFERTLKGETISFEDNLDHQGRVTPFSFNYIPDRDDQGRIRGFVGLRMDISHHKASEEELIKAKEAADAANRAKTAFLANMSHEIRTPLGVVLGFSELLLNTKQSNLERSNCVEAIRRNGQILSSIINDILDLSKIEAGKLEIERTGVSMAELLSELKAVLNLQAMEKGIKLHFTIEGNIPPSIETDPLRLRQILMNIVGNAIKFTEKGFVNVSVEARELENSRKMYFTVTDTGTGIAAEKAKLLFEPFSQADISTTRKFGGSGLGLVLSRKLAQALGGNVALKSTIFGEGSTFEVSIDIGTSIPLEENPVEIKRGDTRPQLQGLKVLLVEDSPDNQMLITRFLKLAGARVELAENGLEAVEKSLKGDFDVVLMDIQMPILDGYEATVALRKKGYARPIIALTAHAMKEERERCLANGFDDHVGKPIDRARLIKRLERFASHRAASSRIIGPKTLEMN